MAPVRDKRNSNKGGGGSVKEEGLPTGELHDGSPVESFTPVSEHAPTSRLKCDLIGSKSDLTSRRYTDRSKVVSVTHTGAVPGHSTSIRGSPMSAPAGRGKAPAIDQHCCGFPQTSTAPWEQSHRSTRFSPHSTEGS